MKIGILGGTFNPIHNGHIKCAESVLKQFALDKIIFVPSRTPVHKKLKYKISVEDKVNLINLAIKHNSNFVLSKNELERKEDSYTIYTVNDLINKNSQAEYYFILGVDSFNTIRTWKEAKKLIKLVYFIVMKRPGKAIESDLLKWVKNVFVANNQEMDVSSTEIRNLLKNNKDISNYVCKEVAEYIYKHKLYMK
jgi:nicotinate-nucleotide adenylyltransferase